MSATFGPVYKDGAGQPPLPTRLMAGLAIIKHAENLSDEDMAERWVRDPYYQYLCGEEFFQHKAPFDRSSLTRWRQRIGEERLAALVLESLRIAHATKALSAQAISLNNSRHRCPTSPLRTAYLYFVIHTKWYLQSHTVWLPVL